MARLIDGFEQFFDGSGNPLVSGQVFFYESGSSTVFKDTFADTAETTTNSNPVIVNGDGRCPNVFGTGSYRAILKTSEGVQILSRDPVGGDVGLTFGADWNSTQAYGSTDVVRDAGVYWLALTSNNQGNQPSTDGGTNWRVWPSIEEIADGSITSVKLADSSVTPAKVQFPNPNYYVDSGVANAYIATAAAQTPTSASYFDGMVIKFAPLSSGTGAATVNVGGVGAIDIKLEGGVDDPSAGDIIAGQDVELIYRTSPSAHAELKQPFGAGQAWVDVTGSRAIGTPYTNTTGAPISVHIIVEDANPRPRL